MFCDCVAGDQQGGSFETLRTGSINRKGRWSKATGASCHTDLDVTYSAVKVKRSEPGGSTARPALDESCIFRPALCVGSPQLQPA